MGLIVCCGICIMIILILIGKLYFLRCSLREITEGLTEKLSTDTNTTISISSSDPYAKKLASRINQELQTLRKERLKLQSGDMELNNAITNIVHDLRTPLTAISGYLELLEEEERNEKVARYIDIITERTEVIKDLVEELFRYSIIRSNSDDMNIDRVSLNKALEVALAGSYGVLKEQGIEPVIRIPEQSIERFLDKAALQRIFSNILGNVAKYSDGDLEVALEKNGRITFANTATLLSEVEVGKLFDRFYTVENAKESTGLGLSIAKLLTEKMGGSIKAYYVENKLKIEISFSDRVKCAE